MTSSPRVRDFRSVALGLGVVALLSVGAGAAVQAAPATAQPTPAAPAAAAEAGLPIPPGATAAQVAAGMKVFKGGSCAACHGADAAGTAVAPSLVSGTWLWGDGGLASLTETIRNGVAAPKQYRSPMPPMGGAQLSDTQASALAAYVWGLSH